MDVNLNTKTERKPRKRLRAGPNPDVHAITIPDT